MSINNESLQAVQTAISSFHRDQHGISPESVTVFEVGGMLLVRSTSVFTLTEQSLVTSDEGRKIVQSARRELRALTRRQIEAIVSAILEVPIHRSYYDLDVRIGEQVEVYMLGK